MSTPAPTWLVIVTSPFGRGLVVTGIVAWLFLHGVATAIGVPPNSAVSSGWVLVMTLALLAVELRRRRLRDLFAVLGVSGASLWGAAVITLGVLEVVFRLALAVME